MAKQHRQRPICLSRPPTGQVHLRAQFAASRLMLAGQDNGLGLNATQQVALFGMFRRLHSHVEGSGVGLFMGKCLVDYSFDGPFQPANAP